MEFRSVDLLHHLHNIWWYRNMKLVIRLRQGIVIWARSDYILGTDRRYFETVVIRGVKNYPPDHLVLISRFLFSPTEEGHQCDTGFIPAQVVNLYRGGEYNGRYQPYTGVGSGYVTGD